MPASVKLVVTSATPPAYAGSACAESTGFLLRTVTTTPSVSVAVPSLTVRVKRYLASSVVWNVGVAFVDDERTMGGPDWPVSAQEYVRFWLSGSFEAVPSRVTSEPSSTVWSGPAFTVGPRGGSGWMPPRNSKTLSL